MTGRGSSTPLALQLLRLQCKNLETVLKLRGWISQLNLIQDQLQTQVNDTINASRHLDNIEKAIKNYEPKEEASKQWPAGTHHADEGDLEVVYELIMRPPTASLAKVHRPTKGK